jgi:asparagine synthase (glutamine-hydrolysing)
MTNPLYLKLISRNRIPRFMQDIFFCAAADKLLDLRHPQQAVFYDLEPDFAESVGCLEDLYTSEFRDLIPNRNAYRPFVLDLLGLSSIPVAICKLLFDTWLVSNCLSLQDRVSMTSSVEARVPFLDYKLVELAIGLMKGPGRHKTKSKSLLKSALKGCLPDKVLKRGKRGFQPPIREWKTAVIQEYGHMLPRGQMVSQRIIDPDALLLYLNKKEANLHILFKILYFELWYRIVVLGRDAGRISIEKD